MIPFNPMNPFHPANMRHYRLVNAANTLAKTKHPTKYQLQRLVELWVDAGLAVGR